MNSHSARNEECLSGRSRTLVCARAIRLLSAIIIGTSLLLAAQEKQEEKQQEKQQQQQEQQKTAPAADPHNASETPNAQPGAQPYRNTTLGFRYQIPFGWVDRTTAMQSEDEPGKASVLLAIFEHPPEAAVNSVNSAVVIASESIASYPGLKKAEDYLGPLTELTSAQGMKAEGEPSLLTIDAHELVRADFAKPIVLKPPDDKLAMHQSTLITLLKGQIVSFTLIAGSEDEVEVLVEGLHFGVPKPGGR